MNWKDIQLNEQTNTFSYNGKRLFQGQTFLKALKFHAPGLAPVKDNMGCFHIDINGNPVYPQRYNNAFGFYDNRATVVSSTGWCHIHPNGELISENYYQWCGNFQEGFCTVKNGVGEYFHIKRDGNKAYSEIYDYAGDFKYGYACVMNSQQYFTHINGKGDLLHGKWFKDLGVYHKGFATAKDADGWFHIDFRGIPIYPHRFHQIEPFYNGWAFVEMIDGRKVLVSEKGIVQTLTNKKKL